MYSSGIWAYKDPLTTQKLNQMIENTVRISQNHIVGCELNYVGSATVEVRPGSMELEGAWLSKTTTGTLSADNNNHWVGSASDALGTSTAVYVYAFNSAGSDFDVRFGLTAPEYSNTASGTSTGPKMYLKSTGVWYRCVGAVLNGTGAATGAIRIFQQDNDTISYSIPPVYATAESNGAWTTGSCRPLIPTISKKGIFGGQVTCTDDNRTMLSIKPANMTGSTTDENNIGQMYRSIGDYRHTGEREVQTNDSQEIAYYSSDVGTFQSLTISVKGYVLNIR